MAPVAGAEAAGRERCGKAEFAVLVDRAEAEQRPGQAGGRPESLARYVDRSFRIAEGPNEVGRRVQGKRAALPSAPAASRRGLL